MNKDIKSILKQDFDKKKGNNSRYSLRAYAKHLNISPANLSKILSNKLEVTPKTLKQIAIKLNFTPEQYNGIEDQLRKKKKANSLKQLEIDKIRKLQADEFNIISDWYHFAILEIFNLDYHESSPEWIAEKLGMSDVTKIKAAIKRLIDLKLLARDEEGELMPVDHFTSVLDFTFTSIGLRERQKQMMKLSSQKIDTVPLEERDNSSITITFDKKLVPEVKEKIKKFRRSLGRYIIKNSKKRESIYELQINFIPLTED